jgi:hypothetical protein
MHCTIGAEELSYFSSYQTLTAYKKWVNLLSNNEACQKVDGRDRP